MPHVVSPLSVACWCAVMLSKGAGAGKSPASPGRGNAVPPFNATFMFTDYQKVLDPAEPLQLGVTAYQQGEEGAPDPGTWFVRASCSRHGFSFLLTSRDSVPLLPVWWDSSVTMCLCCISCPHGSTQETGLRIWSPVLVPWMLSKTHLLRLLVENISLQQACPVLLKAGVFQCPLGCCTSCCVSAGKHWLVKLL